MLRLTILVTTILCFVVPCSATEIVTTSLDLGEPALYLVDDENYILSFDAEREMPNVTNAYLHLTGTYRTARTFCWNFGNFGGGTWTYAEDPGMFYGFLDAEATICLTRHEFPRSDEIEDFDVDLVFNFFSDTPDWSFLADGTGEICLKGLDCTHQGWHPEICICEHSAVITSAEIVFELGTEVPIQQSQWGAIKAIYR